MIYNTSPILACNPEKFSTEFHFTPGIPDISDMGKACCHYGVYP